MYSSSPHLNKAVNLYKKDQIALMSWVVCRGTVLSTIAFSCSRSPEGGEPLILFTMNSEVPQACDSAVHVFSVTVPLTKLVFAHLFAFWGCTLSLFWGSLLWRPSRYWPRLGSRPATQKNCASAHSVAVAQARYESCACRYPPSQTSGDSCIFDCCWFAWAPCCRCSRT